ncbi:putative sodium-coupled neutral amino acid transporter 11 [Eriocheir sinensis]|uniref:putative sodium-coupled neutral amino acid transporter 11 n=1 Tax=Eriocheir sinensis TaxID=95602 RepID=UPI0021C9EB1D|nr:putative sodium-coupled neutral amino acid transporter 11 [Eriocheir sinensis]
MTTPTPTPASAYPPTEKTYILENTGPPTLQAPPQPPPLLATPDAPPKIPPGLAGYEGDDDPKKEKSSIAFTSFNYINSIVGSGVIGMPYAIYKAGVGMGLAVLVVVTVVTDAALCLMIAAARTAQASTYQDLVRSSFGRPGFILATCFQFMYPFISLISYNIIVGDTLRIVLIRVTGLSSESVLAERTFIVVSSTLLITLPLSLYRNITHLCKVSLCSVVMIAAIALAMVVRFGTMFDQVPATEDAWVIGKSGFPTTIGIMSFAFMCHHSSFLVYESLADNTQARWNRVTHISIGASAVLSITFGMAGFLTFTGYVQGDMFENYCWADDLMNLCRGGYALTILLTYPIECFVARDVLETAFFRDYQPQPFFRHAVLSVIIAILCMLLSFSTDCLGIVLELNGILCAIPLAFILPGLCYIRVEEGPLWASNKRLAWAVTIFGVVTFIAGCISLFSNFDELSQCSHGEEMPYCHQAPDAPNALNATL